MKDKLKTNEQLINDTMEELQKLPKDEIIKILYMAKGLAIVHESNIKAS